MCLDSRLQAGYIYFALSVHPTAPTCDVIVYPPRGVSVSEVAHNVGPEQGDTIWGPNDVISNVHVIMYLLGLCDHD